MRSSVPHTHNGAAIYAQVVKGEVISQMVHDEHDSGELKASSSFPSREFSTDGEPLS